jgi:2,3-bisphosphoglycerate-dependent phosphoglycerate mutase
MLSLPGGAATGVQSAGMPTLVLLRHGESTWNAANRFTGWVDVDLSPRGVEEAVESGRLLAGEKDLELDVCRTSVLTRAIRTADLALHAADLSYLPVQRHWRLNERHYGALQGLNKAEMSERHGAEQVKVWRRGYDTPPPALAEDDPGHPRNDPRYRLVPASALPATECLADVVRRLIPYFEDVIVPYLLLGLGVIVVAHGNSLRALVKHLENIPDDEISALDIPTGIPRRYELAGDLSVLSAAYLGDPVAAAAAADRVKHQADVR